MRKSLVAAKSSESKWLSTQEPRSQFFELGCRAGCTRVVHARGGDRYRQRGSKVKKGVVPLIRALGHEVRDMPVVLHELPAELGLRALLGKDFFAQTLLEIDFVNGY